MGQHKRQKHIEEAQEPLTESESALTSGTCLALALHSCTHCWGLGQRPGRAGRTSTCNCVLRAIFRICYARFRQCAMKDKHICRVSLEANPSATNKSRTWGLKNEEFIADFCLISQRVLTAAQHRLFRYHFLLGADWKLCTRKLRVDRGTFFHEVYRIEHTLGRTFAELQPYSLFPVDQYFASTPGRAGGSREHHRRAGAEPGERCGFTRVDAPLRALAAACS